jgi:hypothetical protein
VREFMFDLGPRFERATGHKLVTAFDSTGLISGELYVHVLNRTHNGIENVAKALIEFLRTPEAMTVIKAKGMEPANP